MSIFKKGLSLVFILLASFAWAEPLVISRGNDQAIPIAVVPFSGQEVLGQNGILSDIVANDLYNSGMYAPIPKENLMSAPSEPNEAAFQEWQALGAQYALLGQVINAGGKVQVNFSLVNVTTQQMVMSANVNGMPQQVRDMAHYIADQAFEKLTGIKGSFSTKILFVDALGVSSKNPKYSLHTSDYDGARANMLVQSGEPILSPRFSPDGNRILYVSFENRKPRIYIQNVKTGAREPLTDFPGLNGAPAWSPNGNQLAFVLSKDGNPEIYMMDIVSRQPRRLTNDNAIDTEPYWGQDGQTIYFTSDRAGKPQIYRLNVANGATERVTFTGNYNANPKLSADDKTLVMLHRPEGYSNFQIAAQDLPTGKIRILSQTNMDESPTVAPNGTMVIYATSQGGRGKLILVSTNGRIRSPLPVGQGDVREPSWSPFLK